MDRDGENIQPGFPADETPGRRAEPRTVTGSGDDGAEVAPAAERRRFQLRSRWIYALVGSFMLLAVLYGIDLVVSIGRVPRGTEVAGVEVGGKKTADAESTLERELGPRVGNPIALRAGAVSTSLDPKSVGLSVDWQATLDRAGEQPLNPFTRLVSLFASKEVGIASIIPDQRLTDYLEKLSTRADFGPREGAIWFDRDQVKSVIPLDGQKLRVEGSRDAVLEHWLDEKGVDLPVDFTPTETKADQVRNLLRTVAEPAASRDVTLVASRRKEDGSEPPVTTVTPPPPASAAEVQGDQPAPAPAPAAPPRPIVMVDPNAPEAVKVSFPRDRIGEYLSFVRRGGSLEPRFDADAAKGILAPVLEPTEQIGTDATFTFSGDTATVVPAVRGRTVEWGPVLAALPDQMKDASGPRMVGVGYKAREPELTTDAASKAGIRNKVGEFTVAAGASGSAQSVLAALNGHFVPGGGTLSMSSVAGTYSGDRGADAVATALFNAAYEAGAQGLTRTPRSIADRAFPAGRDATASADVAFRNGQRTGLVVEAFGTGSSVTVRLWGTREYQVSTSTTPRTDVRSAPTQVSTAPGCMPAEGEDGYAVVVTRTVRRGTDTVSTDTFRSSYAPSPGVTCREAPSQPGTPDGTTAPRDPGGAVVPPGIQIPGLPPIQIPGLPAAPR